MGAVALHRVPPSKGCSPLPQLIINQFFTHFFELCHSLCKQAGRQVGRGGEERRVGEGVGVGVGALTLGPTRLMNTNTVCATSTAW